jgi:hypothetical protein
VRREAHAAAVAFLALGLVESALQAYDLALLNACPSSQIRPDAASLRVLRCADLHPTTVSCIACVRACAHMELLDRLSHLHRVCLPRPGTARAAGSGRRAVASRSGCSPPCLATLARAAVRPNTSTWPAVGAVNVLLVSG